MQVDKSSVVVLKEFAASLAKSLPSCDFSLDVSLVILRDSSISFLIFTHQGRF